MTFRGKLALALASLSAVAIGVCAVTAYAVTDRHLASEVDLSLQQAAAQLARVGPQPSAAGSAAGHPSSHRPAGRSASTGIAATPPAPAPAPPRPGLPLGVLTLVVIQQLSPSGAIVSTQGRVTLPVTPEDRKIAASGGMPSLETVDADGDPYRIETVPIPTGGAFQLGRDLSENESLLGTLRWLFTLIGLVVTLLAAIAGWAIAGRITRRLGQLTISAEEIAATGELRLAVDASGEDEVGRLSRALTSMVHALERSRTQQQTLAQNAGHELRTPLTSMRTNIDVLMRHPDLGAADKESVLSDLDTELGELTSLVNELLELTSDRPDEHARTAVRLDEIAQRVAERLRSRTGREISVEAAASVVPGSWRDLERAMSNLVDNAAKFSAEETSIELVVGPGRIEVRDRGIGIAEADEPYVFDRFYRADSARSAPGSGLGLAIVGRVAEMHGGSAYVIRRDGGGSCIGFTVAGEVPEADGGASGHHAGRS